jgi:hypothetical protein
LQTRRLSLESTWMTPRRAERTTMMDS